ncbi:Cell wall-binding protein YocH precursor [compost metagenome]
MFKKSSLAAAMVGLTVMMAAGTIEAATTTHTAKDNDTFWKLSKQYNVTLDSILKANPTIDPLNLYKGLKITIPSQAEETAATVKSEQTVTALNGNTYDYSKALLVKATAYTAAASENGKWGAVDYFGNKLKVGTVAVDPDMIPLGTKLYITGYNYNGLPEGGMIAVATDIGGSIKGNRIDVFVPGTTSQAKSFGIQNVNVYILE